MLHQNLRIIAAIGVTAVLFVLGGCCNCQKPPISAPPAPISLEEQVSRLRQWSGAMPLIHADIKDIRFDFRDDKGQKQTLNAEGTLAIRHPPATAGGNPNAPSGGEVFLRGKAFDTTAFIAGRNATDWWFIIYQGPDKDTAWKGDASRPMDLARLSDPHSASIFRADLVLDLLALSDLPPATVAAGNRQTLVMRVNDFDATNDLFVEQLSPDGHILLAREIMVDRFSGKVKEVRLYDQAGVMAVRSQLSDYAPVKYAEGVSPPSDAPPNFPRKMIVSYPAQQSVIGIQFAEVKIPASLPDGAFATPNFQNLKVIPVD